MPAHQTTDQNSDNIFMGPTEHPEFWDTFSDQPKVIADKAFKRKMRRRYWADYLGMLITAGVTLPTAWAWSYWITPRPQTPMIYGMGVNLDKGPKQPELIQELGVSHVLLRLPLWDIAALDQYVAFAQRFVDQGQHVYLNLLQDRTHIENPERLDHSMRCVFTAFDGLSDTIQVGNAINRVKWGFYSVQEYLRFYRQVNAIRNEAWPTVQLLGPSVIDFEYHFTARAFFTPGGPGFDGLSALLYVDRMGAPSGRQYGLFDTPIKIRMLHALGRMAQAAGRLKNSSLIITEVNWPLKNTAPYAPTSEKECVSMQDYCQYMVDYHAMAVSSGMVGAVFWHQLVASGYGLINHRGGRMHKTPAFYAYQEMLARSATPRILNAPVAG